MQATFEHDGHQITITTEHATSSYGIPVVLVDGEPTVQVDSYERDPDPPQRTVLDQLADLAGVWNGPETRRQLAVLADTMLHATPSPCGADYDSVIAAFLAEYERRRAAELAE